MASPPPTSGMIFSESPPPPPPPSGPPSQAYPDFPFDYDNDFTVAIDNQEPGGGMAITQQSQEAVIVGYHAYYLCRSAAKYFLGYSYADSGTYALRRTPPATYAMFSNLRAHGYAATGMGPYGNLGNPNNSPYFFGPWRTIDNHTSKITNYSVALAIIRFKSYGLMRFLGDYFGDPASLAAAKYETTRWTTFENAAQVDTLSADGASQLVFAESGGPGGGPTVTNSSTTSTAFPAPLATLTPAANLKMRWLQVPNEYISSDPAIFKPDKILARLGTINKDQFGPYLPGQLLLLGCGAVPVLYPVASSDPTDYPLVGWDIELDFHFSNPPKGVSNALGGSPYYGHRIFPWRDNGLYYYAVRATGFGTSNQEELLPLMPYYPMFSHVQNAALP